MIQFRGDVFAADADAICITTNGMVRKDGRAVMGAGIARAAASRYPGIDRRLGELIAAAGNRVHLLHRGGAEPWPEEARALVSYPTKHDWRKPSPLELVIASARQLVELADDEGWEHIVLPRPGCGLGGLSWTREVGPELARLFDDRFLVSSGA